MVTFTPAQHNAIHKILEDSREYDADTMLIESDGEVTARKDADKTFAGNDQERYFVGYVNEMLRADYDRRLDKVTDTVRAAKNVDAYADYAKAINDAAANTYQDGMSNDAWRLAILNRLDNAA